jgi:hypothetical protein
MSTTIPPPAPVDDGAVARRPPPGLRSSGRLRAVFLGSRIIVLTARPGRIALDLRGDLPRSGVDPDELRGSPEFAELRARVGHAVRSAAG